MASKTIERSISEVEELSKPVWQYIRQFCFHHINVGFEIEKKLSRVERIVFRRQM